MKLSISSYNIVCNPARNALCVSVHLPVMFLASQPSFHFVIHSQIAQGAESARCGLVGGWLAVVYRGLCPQSQVPDTQWVVSVACLSVVSYVYLPGLPLILFPPLAS